MTKKFTERDKQIIALIDRAKKSSARITAVKVELEGYINRGNACTEDCSFAVNRELHEDCKYFRNVGIANDFLLKQLSKFGLAERQPLEQSNGLSYFWKPVYPCVYSKVYTDSETEWTITIDLKESENVLLLPNLVDAFNALAKANGTKKIDVTASGMHMAFLQGPAGIYPSNTTSVQQSRFENFSKSMTPLLPALYFLGANRKENGTTITRSFGPRQPAVSSIEKYCAIAYRNGAVEFRVFDTCYDNREQILDNVAVMARCISKYWRIKYRSPGMLKYLKQAVFFGGEQYQDSINKLADCYSEKAQVQLLNEGLKRIKPPYLSIKEIKMARGFTKTLRDCKELDISRYEEFYQRYKNEHEWGVQVDAAREVYNIISNMSQQEFAAKGVERKIAKKRAEALKKIRENRRLKTLEEIAAEQRNSGAYRIGGN